ncbi:hypothetical protein BDAP_000688 [Binucleata daphniae]
MQQQNNEIEQDKTQKIASCKNIKKNTKNFLELTEEIKKPLYKQIIYGSEKYTKINKNKEKLKKNDKHFWNIFMKQDAIKTFDLAKYMPECIKKYTSNKEIFDKQTKDTRKLFSSGVIDFDKFIDILEKEIVYDDIDKETLANLVDVQMNNFLNKNINSLTLLFPKMQFFMDYYNKYQDDLVFFEDMKHVCMVYGMMHVLETILKCTKHMVDKIKETNNHIIECSDGNKIYTHNKLKPQITHFLATKFELEKMLLYILQSFLATDHFINLVNLFHVETVFSFGILVICNNASCIRKPNKTDSVLLRLSTFCYVCFDALETDSSGTQKNVKYIFFEYFMKISVLTSININLQQFLNQHDLLIRSNCFSIYILRNAGTLCESLRTIYDRLVVIHNHMQNMVPLDIDKKNDKNDLQTITKNSDNKIIDEYQKYKKYIHKRRLNFDKNVQAMPRDTCFYTVVCYILNYMCNYIIACESTFIMSYDITSDKNKIKDAIEQYMKIIENWNDTNYVQKKSLYNDLSFRFPRFKNI